MSLFAVCTLLFIYINREVTSPDHRLKFWLSYLTSDQPNRRDAATNELRSESPKYLPQLLRLLASRDTNQQALAVLAFTAMDGHARPAIPMLENLLRQESSSIAAARALAGIGRASLPVLTNALDSPVRFVRSNAARGIGLLHDAGRPAVPMLIRMLQDHDDDLRYFSSRALGHIAAEPEQAVPALLTRLEDSNLEVRKMAIISLGKFHARANAAIPALRHKVLWGVNQDIRNAAIYALKEVDPTASVTDM